MDILITPQDARMEIAGSIKARRLAKNWTQKTLAERSGVSIHVLRAFEQKGHISLSALIKLTMTLDACGDLLEGFKFTPSPYKNMDEIRKALKQEQKLKDNRRRRGRV